MNKVFEDYLQHYGMPRRSGRYPWGSGDNPYQHSGDFLSRYEELRNSGMSEKDIVKEMELQSTTELRAYLAVARHEREDYRIQTARALKEDGLNASEIGRKMGVNESTVRGWLEPSREPKKARAENVADILKGKLKENPMLDVTTDSGKLIGVSNTIMEEALNILAAEGYNFYDMRFQNVTNPDPRHKTETLVLTTPDITEKSYVGAHQNEIMPLEEYHSDDDGLTFRKLEYPASIAANRIYTRFPDEKGDERDGLIEIRRGVADLDLGDSHYAQVRILVDGTHYLKGMAVYSDDIPDGYDIVFDTSKPKDTPIMGPDSKHSVFKPINTDDPKNPFGAAITAAGQSTYLVNGEEKLSVINKLKEEGKWEDSQINLSSQFLSKQPLKLIKNQLDLTYKDKVSEYNDILELTNPTVKKKMLKDFSDSCDKMTTTLKAAPLPGQSNQVIIPMNNLKDNEVFAPNYPDGTELILIRYPHGGTFEIPKLTVNNKKGEFLGKDVRDAIGINYNTAKVLSGADFDGDSVTVIPLSDKFKVNTTKPFVGAYAELKDFDPRVEYASTTGCRLMKKSEVGREMGMISNLITDMTLKGAPDTDIVKAVKHSMVVIDAQKHKLDYKRSEIDNDIDGLKQLYQQKLDGSGKYGSASTLISNRRTAIEIPERKLDTQNYKYGINPETGEYMWTETGRIKTGKNPETGKYEKLYDKKGNPQYATTKVPRVMLYDDANDISAGFDQERLYANYINQMKALANTARKEYLATPNSEYHADAAKTYKDAVRSLDDKIAIAENNRNYERQANRIANKAVYDKISGLSEETRENKAEYKKFKKKAAQLEITEARQKVGARGKDTKIKITDEEWQAIQAGAISHTKLEKVMSLAGEGEIVKRAMPKQSNELSEAKQAKIRQMQISGYTNADIAESLGISTSTVHKYLS